MSIPQVCPTCGCELAAGLPAGLCAACLLQAGKTSDYARSSGATFTPPPPAELALYFPHLEILELIGQGGMGAVYRARQTRLDRIVALKVLPKSAERGQEFADRFTREAKAMARLSHPNIIGIHDYGEAGGWFYLVMEFVDGVNLRQAMRATPFVANDALAVVGQICDALQYAHDEGVLHRDIKPENILIARKGRLKIADFGLAKLLGTTTGDRHLTATHQVMGTIGYMAPEQLEGTRTVDHRADLYALGVVFYELLTGELPMGRFAAPSKIVQIDVRLDEVVLKTLEKEPDRRYQSASQIKHEVERITAVPAQPSVSPTAPADRYARQLRVLALFLIALGLIKSSIAIVSVVRYISMHKNRFADEDIGLAMALGDFALSGPLMFFSGFMVLIRGFRWVVVIGCCAALVPMALITAATSLEDPFGQRNRPLFVGVIVTALWSLITGIIGLWQLTRPEAATYFRWSLPVVGSVLLRLWRIIHPRFIDSTTLAIALGLLLLYPMSYGSPWAALRGYAPPTREVVLPEGNFAQNYYHALVEQLRNGRIVADATWTVFPFNFRWHGWVALTLAAGTILLLVLSKLFARPKCVWRMSALLAVGALISVVCEHYSMTIERAATDATLQRLYERAFKTPAPTGLRDGYGWLVRTTLHEGFYCAAWCGGIFAAIGAWQIAWRRFGPTHD